MLIDKEKVSQYKLFKGLSFEELGKVLSCCNDMVYLPTLSYGIKLERKASIFQT